MAQYGGSLIALHFQEFDKIDAEFANNLNAMKAFHIKNRQLNLNRKEIVGLKIVLYFCCHPI